MKWKIEIKKKIIENKIKFFFIEKYCFKIIISLLLLYLKLSEKPAIINKNGNNGPIKLGRTNAVVLIISNNWVVIDCFNSNILKICEIHIKPKKIITLIKIYFK